MVKWIQFVSEIHDTILRPLEDQLRLIAHSLLIFPLMYLYRVE
jgi:hypothetical protein